jgi:hypothetical protein
MNKKDDNLQNENPKMPGIFSAPMTSQEASPPTSIKNPSAEMIEENLDLIREVFQKIEQETAEIAELIFDYLISASDEQIMTGAIPEIDDKRFDEVSKKRVNAYLKILNRLFLFSHKNLEAGGVRIINRKNVANLDKKTFAISMCFDGGVSLDILCDIVNTENQARTPNTSLVKITITQAFKNEQTQENQR